MRVCGEFLDEDAALEAHKALVDAGVPAESIDVRSPYPLPDEALPPHRSHPMRLRQWVRLLWVIGATVGFTFVSYTQLIWPIHTAGHPLVSIPVNFIITYECGMITGLVSTLIFLFLETRRYRDLNPAQEEDVPVEHGNIAIVVAGSAVEKAKTILQTKGAKSVVTYGMFFILFAFLLGGCTVKMRDQAYIKSTQAPAIAQPAGTLSMPTADERNNPISYFLPPEMRQLNKKDLPPPSPVYTALKNPVAKDAASSVRGQILFERNCSFCHGLTAQGDGPVGQVFLPVPPDLAKAKDSNVPARDPVHLTDGQLYYYITMGPATMPSFANRLSVQDRFDIINYLRYLQKK